MESRKDIDREILKLDIDRKVLMKERKDLMDNLREIQIIKDNIYKYLDKDIKRKAKETKHLRE